jgi:hypothetical protein
VLFCCACGRKGLLNLDCSDGESRVSSVRLFGNGEGGGKLRCPYKGCEKSFSKPSVFTDTSVIPRQTHYACPHCMSKLEILTDNMKIVDIKATEYPTVFDSPAKCVHFSGGLGGSFPSGALPDDCLVCPKALQCSSRRK